MRVPVVVLLLSVLALAGCTKQHHDPVVTPEVGLPASAFLHDLSPMAHPDLAATPHVMEHYRIAVREGVDLDSYVFRPTVSEPVPVILTVTPYYGGGTPETSPLGNPVGALSEAFVPRGYAVGFVSVTGTGNSGGCFIQGGPQEAADVAGAVEFYGTQEWSNGNVGMIGVSYDGTTPQETWVEAPAHLKTIVPVSGISDMYKYQFVNGVPMGATGLSFTNYYWAIVGLGPAGLEGGVAPTDPGSVPFALSGEACPEQVQTQEAGLGSHGDGNKDAYWQERDFLARYRADPDRERAAVFYVHGLQDYNVKDHNMEGWIQALQGSGVPFKAFLGQWQHAWPDNSVAPGNCAPDPEATGPGQTYPTCRADWWNGTLLAWFDQTLKGRDTGVFDMPAIQVQDDNGTWRGEAVWPPTDVHWWTLHPDAGCCLQASPGQGSVSYYDYSGGQVPTTLNRGPAAASFVSDPVERDLHVSGLPWFRGNATADGRFASLVLTLAERFPDGTERSINFASQSLNHVADPAQGKDTVSGERIDVTVNFLPSEDVLHEGSRLVLYAAGNTVGSDYGGTTGLTPISDGSTIVLDLEGAQLNLPIDDSIVPEDPQPFEKPA